MPGDVENPQKVNGVRTQEQGGMPSGSRNGNSAMETLQNVGHNHSNKAMPPNSPTPHHTHRDFRTHNQVFLRYGERNFNAFLIYTKSKLQIPTALGNHYQEWLCWILR